MAMKRKRTYKGGARKRRRYGRRLGGMRRRYGSRRYGRRRIAGRIHSFKIKTSLTGIDTSGVAAGEITRNYKWSLDQIPNVAEYQSLFDLYKITGVKMEFRVRKQPGGTFVTNAQLPVMWSVVDYDGEANAAVSISNLVQRDNCRITYFNDSNMYIKYFIRPKSLQQSVRFDETTNPPTLTATGRYIQSPRWQDIQQGASIPHFGLLVALQAVGVSTVVPSIDVWQTLYFKARHQL